MTVTVVQRHGGANGISFMPERLPPLGGDSEYLEGITHEGLRGVLQQVLERDGAEREFMSAVHEIIFRVPWLDDRGQLQVNRGFRVQFSSAIGPYKGGLRFRDGVNLSIIKFLGFEQCFKNALTTLPMGGGKASRSRRAGGSDFEPKGRSDAEIMKFCQSFMSELYHHIGHYTDVPAGDIGVGAKEIGYLFGQYKRLTRCHTGTLTGKGLEWGGSLMRPEATGFGAVYFAGELLADVGDSLKGKRCIVSGSGNVAQHCAMKLLEEGAVVLAMSDSRGYVYQEEGLTRDQIMEIKGRRSGRLEEYTSPTAQYVGDKGRRVWQLAIPVDMAFPCATQHELDRDDAVALAEHGCKYVFEGANMPCTPAATKVFQDRGIMYGPGKAVNAGGVAVSGLEMSQDRIGLQWSREEPDPALHEWLPVVQVDAKLRGIMRSIYQTAKAAAKEYDVSLAAGANIAGFLKVAEAQLAQGAV
ncbi:hypothetical protein CHLNCDRAFT_52469 [Chlorella variabilis]|uniref:Glutamate dehydrogenase n=1 Tax=Chlorella variabilis TaxID=554065 RepID=E1ZFJ4_CHLVA|nr:hypothetical protein CHLNCDRAFT_52469 [Chlorella variabilis]EFN55289.1 hypothetical protein CHLNCDRAFT_52469 [Chlorella variabilis]|eukprot:XP_005847391.1 hypothetical protein CHLNCDRAFT_52469 [Chlorella variabilis]